jgi:hypothetical protein
MTQEEIRILRAICQSDYKTYLPQGSSVAAFREFDALVATLAEMKKAGWIELEVERAGEAVKGYEQKYRATAARCTRHGREALRMLGES